MFRENMSKTPCSVFGMSRRKGSFGVELEIEGRNVLIEPPKGWEAKPDGSLKNGGIEYVTRLPVSMGDLRVGLASLFDALARGKAQFADSYRTSTHIHFNIGDKSFSHILGMLVLFSIVEPIWLRLMGPQRDGNLFCLSSYDTGDLTEFGETFARSVEQGHFGNFRNRGKYSSLNFGRMNDLGSMEFRCFPLSLKTDEIMMWAQWIQNLSNIVEAEEDKSYRRLVRRAETDPVWLAGSIFTGVPNLKKVVAPNSIEELMTYGAETGYEISRVLKKYLSKNHVEAVAPKGVKADWAVIDEAVALDRNWREQFQHIRFADVGVARRRG